LGILNSSLGNFESTFVGTLDSGCVRTLYSIKATCVCSMVYMACNQRYSSYYFLLILLTVYNTGHCLFIPTNPSAFYAATIYMSQTSCA